MSLQARHPNAVERDGPGHVDVPVPPEREVVGRDPARREVERPRDPLDGRRARRRDELEAVEVDTPVEDGRARSSRTPSPRRPSSLRGSPRPRNGARSAASTVPEARAEIASSPPRLEAPAQGQLPFGERPGVARRPARREPDALPARAARPPTSNAAGAGEGDPVRAEPGVERRSGRGPTSGVPVRVPRGASPRAPPSRRAPSSAGNPEKRPRRPRASGPRARAPISRPFPCAVRRAAPGASISASRSPRRRATGGPSRALPGRARGVPFHDASAIVPRSRRSGTSSVPWPVEGAREAAGQAGRPVGERPEPLQRQALRAPPRPRTPSSSYRKKPSRLAVPEPSDPRTAERRRRSLSNPSRPLDAVEGLPPEARPLEDEVPLADDARRHAVEREAPGDEARDRAGRASGTRGSAPPATARPRS